MSVVLSRVVLHVWICVVIKINYIIYYCLSIDDKIILWGEGRAEGLLRFKIQFSIIITLQYIAVS